MDILLQAYDYLDSAIGFKGILLLSAMLILFLIQLYYYLGVYARIPKYRNKPGAPERKVEGISVVVVAYKNFFFIENTLPAIMGQDCENFELVVVDIGSNVEFTDALNSLKAIYPNLTTTRFERADRFGISNKMALNVGIKAAKYPYVVITTTDSHPRSEKWLSLMAKGFAKGDVVLGYCALDCEKGLGGRLMRSTRLITGIRYLSAAIKGKPYRGLLQNLGISRKLYFDARGFDHLNMNVGEDDLFIQRIATKHNTSIVLSPNATTSQYCASGLGWWRRQRRFLSAAYRYYPARTKRFITTELITRFLFTLTVIVALIIAPNEIRIGVGALWLLRLAIVTHIISRASRRLGEKGLLWVYPLHDLWAPLDELWMFILRHVRPAQGIWR